MPDWHSNCYHFRTTKRPCKQNIKIIQPYTSYQGCSRQQGRNAWEVGNPLDTVLLALSSYRMYSTLCNKVQQKRNVSQSTIIMLRLCILKFSASPAFAHLFIYKNRRFTGPPCGYRGWFARYIVHNKIVGSGVQQLTIKWETSSAFARF